MQYKGHRASRVASRAQEGKGGKNKITRNEGCAFIIVVKLLRTDTTPGGSEDVRNYHGKIRVERDLLDLSYRRRKRKKNVVVRKVSRYPKDLCTYPKGQSGEETKIMRS